MSNNLDRFGAKYRGKTRTDRRAEAEQCLALRRDGQTVFQIAQALSMTEGLVHTRIKEALDARAAPLVDEYRKAGNDSLDARQRDARGNLVAAEALIEFATAAADPDLILKALAARAKGIELMLRIDERRAKLNGLDAPVQVETTVTVLDAEDAELAQMIRRTRQREAAAAETNP
jgi:hypothetical protein